MPASVRSRCRRSPATRTARSTAAHYWTFGDALHSPIQVDHPEWSAAPDHDPDLSADFRHRLVAELAEPNTIGFGIHFADVVFGHVDRGGNGPAWQPVSA
jgi:hypothetical protein